MLKEAIAMSVRTLGKTHPHVINRMRNLADLYEKMGRVDDSIKVRPISSFHFFVLVVSSRPYFFFCEPRLLDLSVLMCRDVG